MTTSTISSLPIVENQSHFAQLAEEALKYAKKRGASDAAVEVSESKGLSVSVRNRDLETVEQTRDRGLTITVFDGQRRGSASTSDFASKAIEETVDAAWHIARHTATDESAGLPEKKLLAHEYPDLQLYVPWMVGAEEARRLALRAEIAALERSPLITNSEGASVSSSEGHFVLANSKGFMGGYPYSRHGLSVSPIAGSGDNMQRDYWYTSARCASRLASPEAVGQYAADRTMARLSARPIKTGHYPVLFEAPVAVGLLGSLVQAASGGALYRKTSFLVDALGKDIFAKHLSVIEDPFRLGAFGSSPFDSEGVTPQRRKIINKGELKGYFLSTYTARKLGMTTTGNAGGSHNLSLLSSQTRPEDDFKAMLAKLGTGLLVTELIGQGINYVTGDYSRGAFGYWVENGEIKHAVEEITIAGNLQQMFKDIVAVGADVFDKGSKATGSVLISKMSIAGS